MNTNAANKRTINGANLRFIKELPAFIAEAIKKHIAVQIRTRSSNSGTGITFQLLLNDMETGDHLIEYWPETRRAISNHQKKCITKGHLDAVHCADRIRDCRPLAA